jgi:hypothetical protein
MCDDVRGPEAPADWYRDATVSMEGEESPGFVTITNWARRQPGFEELWIDRANHNGWLTLAFSQDAEARQHDLIAAGFADNKVVAVAVPWTMAQMEDLRQRVFDLLRLRVGPFGASFYPQLGIVRAEIYFLKPDVVKALNSQFAGQPVCIEGVDPSWPLARDRSRRPAMAGAWSPTRTIVASRTEPLWPTTKPLMPNSGQQPQLMGSVRPSTSGQR